MPFRAPRLCHCGNVIARGARCVCQIFADRERKARHDAKRPSARARGYDTRWDHERAAFLKLNPCCRRCGPMVAAEVVDHVIPHRGNMRLFWDRSNWQALCRVCHNVFKQAQEHRERTQ